MNWHVMFEARFILFFTIYNLISAQPSWGAPATPAVSTQVNSATAVIEQAQGLALAKNRREALRILDEALQSPNLTAKNKLRILDAIRNISTLFFTDKGQRLYEAAQTAMFENPDMALTRYREALVMEDSNLLILTGIIHSQLAKLDCNGALQTVHTARMLAPHLTEPALFELRALICLGNYESFREKLKSLPTPDKTQDYFIQFLTAQDYMQQKLWKRAGDLLVHVIEDQAKFPEAYYWLYKARAEMDDSDPAFAQKYLSLCKNLTIRDRKKFRLEPRLCAAMKEVEDEVAKKTRDS
jgi:hypothetical protein